MRARGIGRRMAGGPKTSRWIAVALLIAAGAALVVFQFCSRAARRAPREAAPSSAAPNPDPPRAPAPRPAASAAEAPAARLPAGCDALCDCCPSGRDCGARGCDAVLAADERFVLRVEHAAAKGDASVRPIVKVCTPARDGGAAQRCSNAPSFAVSVAELVGAGLEVSVELPVATRTGVFRQPIVLRESIRIEQPTARSLCGGLSFEMPELPIEKLALYLDPIGAAPPARCAPR